MVTPVSMLCVNSGASITVYLLSALFEEEPLGPTAVIMKSVLPFFCLFFQFFLSGLVRISRYILKANLGPLCMPHPGMGPLV